VLERRHGHRGVVRFWSAVFGHERMLCFTGHLQDDGHEQRLDRTGRGAGPGVLLGATARLKNLPLDLLLLLLLLLILLLLLLLLLVKALLGVLLVTLLLGALLLGVLLWPEAHISLPCIFVSLWLLIDALRAHTPRVPYSHARLCKWELGLPGMRRHTIRLCRLSQHWSSFPSGQHGLVLMQRVGWLSMLKHLSSSLAVLSQHMGWLRSFAVLLRGIGWLSMFRQLSSSLAVLSQHMGWLRSFAVLLRGIGWLSMFRQLSSSLAVLSQHMGWLYVLRQHHECLAGPGNLAKFEWHVCLAEIEWHAGLRCACEGPSLQLLLSRLLLLLLLLSCVVLLPVLRRAVWA